MESGLGMQQQTEIPFQVGNPTREQRHNQLMYVLNSENRTEDFRNIIDLLQPPPEITTVCPKTKGKKINVAVIGAGEAGLSAAFELRKIGCNITVFEASKRIGGRIYTYYFDKDKKYYGDMGAMRISASHETTWHYIDLFKLDTSPFATNNVNGLFYLRDSRAKNDPEGISVKKNIYPQYNLTEEERNTPWQKLQQRIYDRYFATLSPQEKKELIEIKPNYSNAIVMRDMINYRQAYEGTGLSQSAISMLGYLSTLDAPFFHISLMEILQEVYTADFAYTYRINGGTINLPNALFKALKDEIPGVYGNVSQSELGNINFRMHTAVDGIYDKGNNQGITLEIRDTDTNQCGYEEYDYIVCAIPFTSLRRVKIKPHFSVRKMQAIRELNYETGQKTFLFMKDRFWEKGEENERIVGGRSSTDLPIISIYYPSDHAMPVRNKVNSWTLRPGVSPEEPGVLLASYNLGEDSERLGNEECPLRIMGGKSQVEQAHGLPCGFIDEKLISWASLLWHHVPYIWSCSSLGKPEDKLLFSYSVTLPEMNDRVFFAGEHVSQKHAWQQGSLQTGMIAANEIAKRIKNRKS
jgi:monoamine oxidase